MIPESLPYDGSKTVRSFPTHEDWAIQVKVRDGDLIESFEILTVYAFFTNNGGIILIRHVSTLGVK